ncbi:hypothetical protein HPB50_027676 [Hyalomma asiaticum]|nr:hypothetical protein HPB50_027676 [Hyalomma asiaticum]
MSPTFPFLVQALAGCFWIGAAEIFTANGCCQPESPLLLRNGVLGAILDDTLMRQLPHVEYGYSASSSRTVTSPAHPGPAGYQALKGTLASASISGHGNTAVTMSPTFPFLLQLIPDASRLRDRPATSPPAEAEMNGAEGKENVEDGYLVASGCGHTLTNRCV